MGCWPWPSEKERAEAASAKKLVDIGARRLQQAAKYKKAQQRAWTGKTDKKQQSFKPGDKAYAFNPHYKDGTRLRVGAAREAEFMDAYVVNDEEVLVLEVSSDFAKVRRVTQEGAEAAEGWLRQRNLLRQPGTGTPDPDQRLGLRKAEGRTSEFVSAAADTDKGGSSMQAEPEDTPTASQHL